MKLDSEIDVYYGIIRLIEEKLIEEDKDRREYTNKYPGIDKRSFTRRQVWLESIDRVNKKEFGICYAKHGLCLTKSVFMSLRDFNNEGAVLGGILLALME